MWFSWSASFAQSEALLLAGLSSKPAGGGGREPEGQLALAARQMRDGPVTDRGQVRACHLANHPASTGSVIPVT